jgi:outer membrane protein
MYKVLGERGRLGVGAGVASFIELTEDWRIVLSLSAEFLPDEIVNSPIVTDDRIMKGFAAITYVF